MKFVSLLVENFRGVRRAEIEFGPGLNVLYGPNDLGKSSLATAIRAALLMQASSREHEEFVSWHEAGEPEVHLVFESEPQRIWRVRKKFSSAGQSFLDESRNGVEFSTLKRGREVDGHLSEILRWGLAPPGLKGRPKGMPMTFLSTALLAEQERVAAIFERALSDDSDESGRNRLTEALQAAAEDPLYKRVLDQVQERVDVAFTSTGQRKRGQGSPWIRIRDAIQRKEAEVREWDERLQRTQTIEAEMRELRARQLECKDRVGKAEGNLRLQEQRAELTEVLGILRLAREAEQKFDEAGKQVEAAAKRELAARQALGEASRQAVAAKDEVGRLKSEDRVRERLLQRESIEKTSAQLRARLAAVDGRVGLIERVRRAAMRVRELESEGARLETRASGLRAQHEQARTALEEAGRDERDLLTIGQWLQCVDARKSLAEAAAGLAQVDAWRAAAQQKRAAAAALAGSGPAGEFPSAPEFQSLRSLDQELRIATGKLEVGLHIAIRPKKKLRASLRADDGAPVDALEATARREIAIELEGIAEITVSGGAADARKKAMELRARWLAEGEPALAKADAASLDDLARMMEERADRDRRVKDALNEAAQLEQRVADQQDWARLRDQRQAELSAAERALAGVDESAVEKLARKLRIANKADADKRVTSLRAETAKRNAEERRLSDEAARGEAARQAHEAALTPARQELADAQSAIEGDWESALRQCQLERQQIDAELKKAQAQLSSLGSEDDAALLAAQKLLAKAETARVDAETAHERAGADLRRIENVKASLEGELNLRREAAARCDEAGARAAVSQAEVELGAAAAMVDVDSARRAVQEARAELQRVEDDINAKRGALQHVGGDVARQHAADALDALRAEREREQETQNDYDAWNLLRNTLVEAEREEGIHLGRALGGPITARFSELTNGRYGDMALGPNLDVPGITAAGALRDLAALSVGTRDQLSTIFRLSLAEQLNSAVLLDDQLVQTDSHRMGWLRDLIREVTSRIQVIVFTCRPGDYLRPEEFHGAAVRVIDLAQVIQRGAAVAPRTTAAGG